MNTGCSLRTDLQIRGLAALVLENELLEVTVLAGRGTDIISFVYKPSRLNLLWRSRTGARNPATDLAPSPDPSSSYMDYYPGGWQEIFPNGGDPCVYRGASLGFHGDICKVAWDYEIERNDSHAVQVRCWTQAVRMPFLVEKRLRLEASFPTLVIEERIVNESDEVLECMWGHHPTFGAPFLSPACRLSVPARVVETHPDPLPGAQRLPRGLRGEWPVIPGADGRPVDLRRIPGPESRTSDVCYLTELDEGWYALQNTETGLGFALSWDERVFPHIWLWQECCGTRGSPWWGREYVCGIEPHSSIPGCGLLRAIERGTALRVDPRADVEQRLLATAFQNAAPVERVTGEGTVVFGRYRG
jgi:hypothetical protein